MTQASRQGSINRASYLFDVYIAPLFFLSVGLVLFILAFTMSFPELNSLSEVRGHLNSYSFYQTGRGRDAYYTIISLQEGPRFWTHAIDKDNAEAILKERGLEVRFYIDPHSTYEPVDGDAVKAYGVWVNGVQIQSAEEAVNRDKLGAHFGLPVVGILNIGLAVFIYRRKKAKYLGSA